MSRHKSPETPPIPIIDLRPNQENVHVIARVLRVLPKKVINTKRGLRTISNAVIGDETGRIRVTLWGRKAGILHEGEVVEITGAWTTVFKGEVQLNIGSGSDVVVVDNDMAPPEDKIPLRRPKAPRRRPRQGR